MNDQCCMTAFAKRSPYAVIAFCILACLFASASEQTAEAKSEPRLVPEVEFDDFATTTGMQLVGSAARSGAVLRLTPAQEHKVGAAWYGERLPVAKGFDTTFQFKFTNQGGLGPGADGLAFVLQNNAVTAVGGKGGAGGFAIGAQENRGDPGIPRSIAVFFDTFKNVGDPSDNYISICANGGAPDLRWPPPRLASTRFLRVALKDSRVHTARVVYEPPIMSVFLDNPVVPVLQSVVDLSTVVDGRGTAYAGFTASTGMGWENHDILSWSMLVRSIEAVDSRIVYEDVQSKFLTEDVESKIRFLKCLPDKNLCTPQQPIIEGPGRGRYHVVLPAHLGVSIPNPTDAKVTVRNTSGTICWDLTYSSSVGCNGPRGNGIRAGEGFLAPSEEVGALIYRTEDGKTYFSVNGRIRNVSRNNDIVEFKNHEGAFEFDVELSESRVVGSNPRSGR